MPDAAFEATFGCHNCGDEWSEELPKRTVVRDASTRKDVVVRNKDCDDWVGHCDGCCYYVRCPTCELLDDVYVVERTPVEVAD